MKVIGAGFPRTGTMSLQAALNRLGVGPCYHMRSIVEEQGQAALWQTMVDGGEADFNAIFANFESTVDAPACFYYKELMGKYPDAKVLLSLRDSERWHSSVLESIYLGYLVPRWMEIMPSVGPFLKLTRTMVWEGLFEGRLPDKQFAISIYEAHNAEVQKVVPSEKLLIFNAKDGWEPLCAFLGVPVPEGEPFPHLNDKAEARRNFIILRTMGYVLPLVGLGIVGALIWGLLSLF